MDIPNNHLFSPLPHANVGVGWEDMVHNAIYEAFCLFACLVYIYGNLCATLVK